MIVFKLNNEKEQLVESKVKQLVKIELTMRTATEITGHMATILKSVSTPAHQSTSADSCRSSRRGQRPCLLMYAPYSQVVKIPPPTKILLPNHVYMPNTLCFEDSTSSKAGTLTYEHQGNKTFMHITKVFKKHVFTETQSGLQNN
ncbi:hypothetical protein GQX74_002401 [Glossina fuscipes]|nr:hypothetical protein GQX74_002401 [Glossina fuscipes]